MLLGIIYKIANVMSVFYQRHSWNDADCRNPTPYHSICLFDRAKTVDIFLLVANFVFLIRWHGGFKLDFVFHISFVTRLHMGSHPIILIVFKPPAHPSNVSHCLALADGIQSKS